MRIDLTSQALDGGEVVITLDGALVAMISVGQADTRDDLEAKVLRARVATTAFQHLATAVEQLEKAWFHVGSGSSTRKNAREMWAEGFLVELLRGAIAIEPQASGMKLSGLPTGLFDGDESLPDIALRCFHNGGADMGRLVRRAVDVVAAMGVTEGGASSPDDVK
jgi:hypothetical protein